MQIQGIFGWVPFRQYKHICDLISGKGFAVPFSDIFGSQAWPEDKICSVRYERVQPVAWLHC